MTAHDHLFLLILSCSNGQLLFVMMDHQMFKKNCHANSIVANTGKMLLFFDLCRQSDLCREYHVTRWLCFLERRYSDPFSNAFHLTNNLAVSGGREEEDRGLIFIDRSLSCAASGFAFDITFQALSFWFVIFFPNKLLFTSGGFSVRWRIVWWKA